MLIGTEIGMLYRLQEDNPEKEFYPPSADTVCPNMKLTTLDAVVEALKGMHYRITVDESVRQSEEGP